MPLSILPPYFIIFAAFFDASALMLLPALPLICCHFSPLLLRFSLFAAASMLILRFHAFAAVLLRYCCCHVYAAAMLAAMAFATC